MTPGVIAGVVLELLMVAPRTHGQEEPFSGTGISA